MKFRPCIDIHNGKVKQIVGGSLRDEGDEALTNFESTMSAAEISSLYKEGNIVGAHVIMLNSKDSEYYEITKKEALSALEAYPGGLQIGGSINAENANEFLKSGADKVIVTSYVFKDGRIYYDNLEKLSKLVSSENLVLDLSVRKKDGRYYIVTDRWQKFTDEELTVSLFSKLKVYADEFLVHGVDNEGRKQGVDYELIKLLTEAVKMENVLITYAGGISSMKDIEEIESISGGLLDFTVGSALDIFGGRIKYSDLIKKY